MPDPMWWFYVIASVDLADYNEGAGPLVYLLRPSRGVGRG